MVKRLNLAEWVDSWAGRSAKTNLISQILLKSRKREITIAFTAQSIMQVAKRIRDVCDFISYPLMSVDNSYCRLEVFRGPSPSISSRIKPALYFNCEPVYAIYDTFQEIRTIPEEEEEEFREIFLPISENPAFRRYLIKEKGIVGEDQIKRYCERIQNMINPEGITQGVRKI